MSIWHEPCEWPEDGRRVVVICSHWKNIYPGSLEIFGGEFDSVANSGPIPHLVNYDEHGKGSYAPDWKEDVQAWCYAEDFRPLLPSFLKFEGEK